MSQSAGIAVGIRLVRVVVLGAAGQPLRDHRRQRRHLAGGGVAGAALELVQEAILNRDAETDGAHLQARSAGRSGLLPAAPSGTCAASVARTEGSHSGALGSIVGSSCARAVPGPPMTVSPASPATPSAAPDLQTGADHLPAIELLRAPTLSRMLRPFRTSSDMLDLLVSAMPRGRTHSGRDRGLGSWEDKTVVGIPTDAQRVPVARGAVAEQAFVLLHLHQPPGWQRERDRAQAPGVLDRAHDRFQFVVGAGVVVEPAQAVGTDDEAEMIAVTGIAIRGDDKIAGRRLHRCACRRSRPMICPSKMLLVPTNSATKRVRGVP